jgi:hypothetical protein
VVLGAHLLTMHYSLSLVSKIIIVYHAPTRVLGNDKRFGVELPAGGRVRETAGFPLSLRLQSFYLVRVPWVTPIERQ